MEKCNKCQNRLFKDKSKRLGICIKCQKKEPVILKQQIQYPMFESLQEANNYLGL